MKNGNGNERKKHELIIDKHAIIEHTISELEDFVDDIESEDDCVAVAEKKEEQSEMPLVDFLNDYPDKLVYLDEKLNKILFRLRQDLFFD